MNQLVLLTLRRDRGRLLTWVLSIGLLPALMAVSTRQGYPDRAAMEAFAQQSMSTSPSWQYAGRSSTCRSAASSRGASPAQAPWSMRWSRSSWPSGTSARTKRRAVPSSCAHNPSDGATC